MTISSPEEEVQHVHCHVLLAGVAGRGLLSVGGGSTWLMVVLQRP